MSAGSAWPRVLRSPSWARAAAHWTPRAVGPLRPPRAGRGEGPAVHLLGRRLLAAGLGGCVLPVTDSDEPRLLWAGGQG